MYHYTEAAAAAAAAVPADEEGEEGEAEARREEMKLWILSSKRLLVVDCGFIRAHPRREKKRERKNETV